MIRNLDAFMHTEQAEFVTITKTLTASGMRATLLNTNCHEWTTNCHECFYLWEFTSNLWAIYDNSCSESQNKNGVIGWKRDFSDCNLLQAHSSEKKYRLH